MFKPVHFVNAARVALLVGSLTVTVLTLGPFQDAEQIFGLSETAAHALAFGGLLAIAFLAFPRMRRVDLTIAAIVLSGAVEAAQLLGDRGVNVMDWLADVAGLLAVYAVSMTETLRAATRAHGELTFDQIAVLDRRQASYRQAGTFEPPTEPEEAKERARTFADRASRRFPPRQIR